MSDSHDNTRLLGEIHGMVQTMRDQQKAQSGQLERLDTRLRDQETKAAVSGAYAGTAMALGVTLMIEGLKQALRIKGGGSA